MVTAYHPEIDNPAARLAREERAIELTKKGVHMSIEICPPFQWRPRYYRGPKCSRLVWMWFGVTAWRISFIELVTSALPIVLPEKF